MSPFATLVPGRQLLDSSLIAIEQALQPGELFRGGYGFLVADLPKILASLPGGQALYFQNTHTLGSAGSATISL